MVTRGSGTQALPSLALKYFVAEMECQYELGRQDTLACSITVPFLDINDWTLEFTLELFSHIK